LGKLPIGVFLTCSGGKTWENALFPAARKGKYLAISDFFVYMVTLKIYTFFEY
jgi:hypothetical protein